MKVKHNAAPLRRRVLPSVLIGMLLCEAAPAALAQVVYSVRESDDASASTRVLEMFRGEVRILHFPGTIKRIAIGNGKLITANVVDGSLMLLGERDGITSLVVWNEKGIALQTTVRIAKAEVNASVEQLRAVLKSVSGLHIDAIGSNIVLSGCRASRHGGDRQVCHARHEERDRHHQGRRRRRAQEDRPLQGADHGSHAQRHRGISALRGTARSRDRRSAAPRASRPVPRKRPPRARATSSRASLRTSPRRSTSPSRMATRIILAAPELNTKSGGTASFLAGGEVPIPQSGALGTTNVEYKDYGIKLNIVPVVDANNIISAHLTTEISQIDPSVTYGGMPGFLTRNTSSDISMRAGETLAISGLVSADAALTTASACRFSADCRSSASCSARTAFRAKKSDLVIFVTPLISDPDLAPNTDLLARADRMDQALPQGVWQPRIRSSPMRKRPRLCPRRASRSGPRRRCFRRRCAASRSRRPAASAPPRRRRGTCPGARLRSRAVPSPSQIALHRRPRSTC